MRIRLDLTAKSIIVAGVPLFVGFIFVIFLGFQLEANVKQNEQRLSAQKILTQTFKVSRLFDQATRAMSNYSLTQSVVYTDRFDSIAETKYADYGNQSEIDNQLSLLEDLREPKKEKESALIGAVIAKTKVGINHLKEAKKEMDKTQRDSARNFFREIRSVEGLLEPDIKRLTEFETTQLTEGERGQREAEHMVNYGLIALMVAYAVISFMVALYFRKDITSRLNIIRQNSILLARGEPLHDRLEGEDEIAALDNIFHAMGKSLTEAREKERAVVENAIDVICSINSRGVFTEMNPASQALWQREPYEIIGQRFMSLIHPDDQEMTLKRTEEARFYKTAFLLENRTVARDGTLIDTQWSGCWSPDGASLFCVIHNVSERKKIERLKQEVMQMVSHDLRTPLTSLQMTLQLLLEGIYGQLSEKGVPRVQYAASELDRLISLINQMLDLEKLESGQLNMQLAKIDISEIVTKSVESLRTLAEQRRVTLESRSCEGRLNADGGKLIQVLVNLIGNAVKFSPKDSIVTVSAELVDQRRFVEFKVADQGRGIPKEFLSKIFDRFEQVSIDDHRVKGGSGLGLAIAKTIVQQHGGSIGVISEEGKGSTFWLKVPLGVSKDESTEVSKDESAAEEPQPAEKSA